MPSVCPFWNLQSNLEPTWFERLLQWVMHNFWKEFLLFSSFPLLHDIETSVVCLLVKPLRSWLWFCLASDLLSPWNDNAALFFILPHILSSLLPPVPATELSGQQSHWEKKEIMRLEVMKGWTVEGWRDWGQEEAWCNWPDSPQVWS